MPVTHGYVNPIPDRPEDAAAGKVLPSHWNAEHTISVDLATEVTGTLDPSHLTGVVTSVSNSDGSLTVSPTDGDVVASLNVANANTWTAGQTFSVTPPTFSTMTLGSVLFAGTGGLVSQDNANFFWDDANNRLGIGTTSPAQAVHAREAGDRAVMVADYTGTAASLTSGAGFSAAFSGSDKAVFGWLSPTNTGAGFNAGPVGIAHAVSDNLNIYTDAAKDVAIGTGGGGVVTERFRVIGADGSGSKAGNIGVGVSNPTASLHIKAGSSTAGTAPLKFTSGTLNGTAEAGAVEFLSDKFYGTITTGAARKELQLSEGLTSGRIPYATTNGRLTDSGSLLWDNSNARLGIGAAAIVDVQLKKGVNGGVEFRAENSTNGTGAYVGYAIANNTGNVVANFHGTSASWTTSGIFVASGAYLYGTNTAGLWVGNNNASGPLGFFTGGAAASNERAQIDVNGNFVIGTAALATNATNGFLYIPTCAGAPSGTPTSKTGRVAMVYDTTNNALCIYNGGWKKVTLS